MTLQVSKRAGEQAGALAALACTAWARALDEMLIACGEAPLRGES